MRGAFFGALLVGVVDTAGRALLPPLVAALFGAEAASGAAAALASMLIYLLMAAVLFYRPQGLLRPTAEGRGMTKPIHKEQTKPSAARPQAGCWTTGRVPGVWSCCSFFIAVTAYSESAG